MYQWLEESLEKYYKFIKVLKKKDNGEIILYKHCCSNRYMVVKKLEGYYPVYDRLVNMKHGNFPHVYEVCNDGNKTIVVEEYIQGITVADILENSNMSIYAMKQIIMQVCDGLYALHSNQIIHRDMKPENVIIQENGQVKIIDFDASRIYKLYETKDTKWVGTIGYAAPEQYGEAQSDERTDIYALGIMMNVMLTGKHPANLMAQGKIGKIIEKCIKINPEQRYKTVLEIKEKLKKV